MVLSWDNFTIQLGKAFVSIPTNKKTSCKTMLKYIILEDCCAHFNVQFKLSSEPAKPALWCSFSLAFKNPLYWFFYCMTCILSWFRVMPVSPWGRAYICDLRGSVLSSCSVLLATVIMKWAWSEMSSNQ